MALKFRNIDADPADPVKTWGFEGVLTALDRGDLSDWSRVLRVIETDPWGDVARQFEIAAKQTEDRGAGAWAKLALARVRDEIKLAEKREVAGELAALVARSGLTAAQFASRTGTSASRLSAYLSAKTCPSAAYMVRARRLSDSYSGGPA